DQILISGITQDGNFTFIGEPNKGGFLGRLASEPFQAKNRAHADEVASFIVTIFGYGAPNSDAEAGGLMKRAWGRVAERNLEEIEIIDIRPGAELRDTWSSFIHTHHYRIVTD